MYYMLNGWLEFEQGHYCSHMCHFCQSLHQFIGWIWWWTRSGIIQASIVYWKLSFIPCPYILISCQDSAIWHIVYTVEPLFWGHPFFTRKVAFQEGGLSSGVEFNILLFKFTVPSVLFRRVGLSSGWPLKRGSTVMELVILLDPFDI